MRFSNVALGLIALVTLTGFGDDNRESTTTPEPEPTPINRFVIQGIATDAPMKNATITASFGDQTSTTTADENGQYMLEFFYRPGTLSGNEMVVLNALGEGDQNHIELISQLGSFSALQKQAGTDGVLTQDESARTAITQVSTALHLLAKDTGIALTSDAALAEAEAQVNTESLMMLIALIKVLADNPDFTPKQGTTLERLTPIGEERVDEVIEAYLQENGLVDEDWQLNDALETALDTAQEETLKNPAMTLAFSAEDLLGTNLFTVNITRGWMAQNDVVLNLAADGRSSVNNPGTHDDIISADVATEWHLTEQHRLVVSYSENREAYSSYLTLDDVAAGWGQAVADALAPNWQEGHMRYVESTDSIEFIRLTAGEASQVVISSNKTFTLDPTSADLSWEGALPSYQERTVEAAGVMRLASQLSPLWDSAPEGTWALPMVSSIPWLDGPRHYLIHDDVTLAEGGSVLDEAGETRGQWQFADGRLSITSGDWIIRYQPYARSEALMSAIVSVVKGELEQSAVRWIAPCTLRQDQQRDGSCRGPVPPQR